MESQMEELMVRIDKLSTITSARSIKSSLSEKYLKILYLLKSVAIQDAINDRELPIFEVMSSWRWIAAGYAFSDEERNIIAKNLRQEKIQYPTFVLYSGNGKFPSNSVVFHFHLLRQDVFQYINILKNVGIINNNEYKKILKNIGIQLLEAILSIRCHKFSKDELHDHHLLDLNKEILNDEVFLSFDNGEHKHVLDCTYDKICRDIYNEYIGVNIENKRRSRQMYEWIKNLIV
jgi:hypothetical protein